MGAAAVPPVQMRFFSIVCVCAAENSIVVAEGHLQHNGTFAVVALGLPPVESREESFRAVKVTDSL